MSTISLERHETRTRSVVASPQTVLAVLADPQAIPRWAPAFARAIRPDRDAWLVDTGAGEARITVRTSAEHGTVDLLAAADPRRGAFLRVVPNGTGSEVLFTLVLPPDAEEAAVAAHMARSRRSWRRSPPSARTTRGGAGARRLIAGATCAMLPR